MKKIVALLVCALAVTSCATADGRMNYNAAATSIAGSKSLRREMIGRCIARMHQSSRSDRHTAALIMDVDESQVEQLYCVRIFNAIANGRISYREFMMGQRGQITPNLVRVIQGR